MYVAAKIRTIPKPCKYMGAKNAGHTWCSAFLLCNARPFAPPLGRRVGFRSIVPDALVLDEVVIFA